MSPQFSSSPSTTSTVHDSGRSDLSCLTESGPLADDACSAPKTPAHSAAQPRRVRGLRVVLPDGEDNCSGAADKAAATGKDSVAPAESPAGSCVSAWLSCNDGRQPSPQIRCSCQASPAARRLLVHGGDACSSAMRKWLDEQFALAAARSGKLAPTSDLPPPAFQLLRVL
jgi:hypothetical protein